MSNIHHTAVVESGAQLGANVTIEPYAIVKGSVTLGDNVIVKSHAYIDGNTTIGEGSVIYPGASIGTVTQDLKYRGERTFVEIGKRCQIREFVTINASCGEDTAVKVGDDCLIMAYCHVAHNCIVGDNVIMANGAMLAGHVEVESFAIIGGMTPVHQFVRIGRHAMVGGLSRITHDIPPYTIGAGIPYKLGGLNLVGLKRRGFSLKERQELTAAFKTTYRSNMPLEQAIAQLEEQFPNSLHIAHWIAFCKGTKRGLIGFHDETPLKKGQGDYSDLIEDSLEEVVSAKV